ncbi:acyltransferase [Thomasclavelia spiroformis]|uniref:acyltransferase n=1 Tax=Thomasclavelia spiroformis TaxID=29348 RepID=UPI00255BC1EF|nr:acyltransferase [Thomasclavelia spiroformis]
MNKKLKEFIYQHPRFIRIIIKIINKLPFNNKIHIKFGNKIKNSALLRSCKIVIKGKNNEIVIEDYTRLIHSSISIYGNNNKVIIGSNCFFYETDIHIEDFNGTISIGKNTSICGKTHLACIEGKAIEIGENCLFSSDIVVRTGDSHSILNMDEKRTNPSMDVYVGNHVWVGNRVIVLKGSVIENNSIVATGSIVTKKFNEGNVILGGNPAKVIKENIKWTGERL